MSIPDVLVARLKEIHRAQMESPNRDDPNIAAGAILVNSEPEGSCTYLRLDGSVLVWEAGTPHAQLAPDGFDRWSTIVLAAEDLGLPELEHLLPVRPNGSTTCPSCSGSRWVQFGVDPETGTPGRILCTDCEALGWVSGS